MSQTEPGSTWTIPFWSTFRLHAHQLLAFGYQDAESLIRSHQDEEEITGFIREAIQIRLRASNSPKWTHFYAVRESDPVIGKNRKGRSRKKTDITVEFTSKQRPEFIFEAKRLSHKGHQANTYIGKEGLQRFIRGDYANRYPEAAMVAYVQDDSVNAWGTSIKEAIEHVPRTTLRLTSPQRDINILAEFPVEWKSEHSRVKAPDIAVYHIFLDCCH